MKIPLQTIFLGLILPALVWLMHQVNEIKVTVARIDERVLFLEKSIKTAEAAKIDAHNLAVARFPELP